METTSDSGVSKNVFDRSLAVCISMHKWGIRRKVQASDVNVRDAFEDEPVSPEAIAMSKRLIESASYDAIGALDMSIRNELQRLALPASMLRKGMYLVPLASLERVEHMIMAYQVQREGLISDFIAVYGDAISRARETLGPLFREDQYPDRDAVRSAFGVKISYVSFEVPGKLRSISEQLYNREKAKLTATIEQAGDEIRRGMREALAQLVGHLQSKLSEKRPDGRPAIFRDSAVQNIKDWLELLPTRNILDDTDLEVLAGKARQLLDGVAASDLRSDVLLRERVSGQMTEIKASLDTLVTSQPVRKFSWNDE